MHFRWTKLIPFARPSELNSLTRAIILHNAVKESNGPYSLATEPTHVRFTFHLICRKLALVVSITMLAFNSDDAGNEEDDDDDIDCEWFHTQLPFQLLRDPFSLGGLGISTFATHFHSFMYCTIITTTTMTDGTSRPKAGPSLPPSEMHFTFKLALAKLYTFSDLLMVSFFALLEHFEQLCSL